MTRKDAVGNTRAMPSRVWPVIIRAESSHAAQLAKREDESADRAVGRANVASLLGIGFAILFAGRHSRPLQVSLIGVAVLTVVLSWTPTLVEVAWRCGAGVAGLAISVADIAAMSDLPVPSCWRSRVRQRLFRWPRRV
jgi:hypothetical protein